MSSQPVVVAVAETEEAREAVRLGVRMARLLGARLVLGSVAVAPTPIDVASVPGWAPDAVPEAIRERARHFGDAVRGAVPDDVPCTVRVVAAADVVGGLQEIAELEQGSLLILGASHTGALAHVVEGDVAVTALRRAGCSVLLAPAASAAPAAEGPPRVIGVAWDGSDEAAAALRVAVALAAASGARVRVLHAFAAVPPLAVPYLDPTSRDAQLAERRAQAERAAAEAVAAASAEVVAEPDVREGDPVGVLADASAELDLLVMGSRRRGPLRRVAFGSVSAGLAHRAHCPVLVVPREARTPVVSAAPAGR